MTLPQDIHSVIEILYSVESFLRYDLSKTLKDSPNGVLEPQEAWVPVSNGYRSIIEKFANLLPAEREYIEATFGEAQSNLNLLADLMREVAAKQRSGAIDEHVYLQKVNDAILKAREDFSARIAGLEEVFSERPKKEILVGASHESKPFVDQALDAFKNNRFLAVVILIGMAVIALGTLTASFDQIVQFIEKYWSTVEPEALQTEANEQSSNESGL